MIGRPRRTLSARPAIDRSDQPILRHIETRLCYCDADCYASLCPDNLGIGPFTPDQAGAVLESALTFLYHTSESDLAY